MSDDRPDRRDTDLPDHALAAALERTWGSRPGLYAWFASVDHKSVARSYIATAFIFLAFGGVLGVLMRIQLARPENRFIGPDLYNQIFTMHGTNMMFLFAVPVMEAIGIYLVPLMIGSRNIAFPRLNAFSYWMFLAGGILLWGAFLVGVGPDVGWFAYPPLSGPQFGAGKRADVWAQMITFTEIAALSVAVSLVATIFKQRAPGLTLERLPLFCWAQLVMAFMVILGMPAVVVASGSLILDRLVGTHFFNPVEGGDVLLFQHLFWFFGHPEVYIIFLPAVGIVSAVLPAFARRPTFGHMPFALAFVTTGVLSFGLWVHHMFTTGLPRVGESFFTIASMAIALPAGLQIFCCLATLWDGRLIWRTPLLFVVGFVVTFVMGGLTGVMVASVPLDTQVHDTYFVVAHFHYVLIGGAVFPLLAGIYYWFPKVTGRLMSERIGRWVFALVFGGFHLTFFPMHLLGLAGMPRRVYTYAVEMNWGGINLLSTVGSVILAGGFLLFFVDVVRSARRGAPAGADPWQAPGLEWATPSPPPPYNFARVPVVTGPHPLWDRAAAGGALPVAGGLSVDRRELIVSTVTDAEPQARDSSARDSIWPFWSAVIATVMLAASVFTPWAIAWGTLPLTVALIGWFWPKGTPEDDG